MSPQQQLALLIPLALAAPLLPTIGGPFLWFEAYFHQASEAMVVFASGGTPLQFSVRFSGSANTDFRGSSEAFIVLTGYLGSVFWSLILFAVPSKTSPWVSMGSALILVAFVSLAWPFWGVGGDTLAIALAIDAVIIGVFYFRHIHIMAYVGKFLAIVLCLSGPRLSLMNILAAKKGVVDEIATAYQISPFAIITVWTGMSIMALAVMFAMETKPAKGPQRGA